jgi:EpsI family protein
MEKGLARELYFFWYQGRGRIYASEYWNKIYLVWDGLTKNRTDGALIRVNSSIVGERDENETMRNQIQFIELIIPLLNEYIPD